MLIQNLMELIQPTETGHHIQFSRGGKTRNNDGGIVTESEWIDPNSMFFFIGW